MCSHRSAISHLRRNTAEPDRQKPWLQIYYVTPLVHLAAPSAHLAPLVHTLMSAQTP